MSFPKLLALFAFVLFSLIAVAGVWKKQLATPDHFSVTGTELLLSDQEPPQQHSTPIRPQPPAAELPTPERALLPEADCVEELFRPSAQKLPIVETVVYRSRAAWLKGRPAWVSDYASHHNTSRHFIGRSLHGKGNYFQQDVAEGDRFNVYRNDIEFQFNLVIDLSRCKLWLYYQRPDIGERVLLKSYQVALGKEAPEKESKLLTPVGQYKLGSRVAVYKPGVKGIHNGKQQEMIRIFGTRWIPFEREIGSSSEPARGFGIHGTPWLDNGREGLAEVTSHLGQYVSDGCIHLCAQDMEELFAIVVARPTAIELVRDYTQAQFPLVPKVQNKEPTYE